MSYKWFKEWADKSPKTIVLIETHEGFESFGTCATVIFRLTGIVPFRPNKKEKTKEPEVIVPRKDYPALLDKMNRCQISYLVAREDFKVYSKECDPRFFDIFAAPIENPLKATEEDRIDRGISVDDRITVKNLETRKECRWTLVPEAEADVSGREKNGNLSIESEVGAALIGHHVGEDVLVVRGMNDSATYRIQLALDAEGHKLKKVKRETVVSEAEQAAEAEEAAPKAETTAAPVIHARGAATLMDDDGPVMVFHETVAEETTAEETVAEETAVNEEIVVEEAIAAEEVATEEIAAEEVVAEEPVAVEEMPESEDTLTSEATGEEASDEEPLADEEPAEAEASNDTAEPVTEEAEPAAEEPKKLSFFQRLFGCRKAKHKAVKSDAKHLKTHEPAAEETTVVPDVTPAESEQSNTQ